MQKLTKEQAEWLIERFDETRMIQDSFGRLYKSDVEKIINECAEKKFPEFVMSITTWDRYCLSFEQFDKDGIKICCNKAPWLRFSFDEFKQFAEGVNKIVEWLKEQE